MHRRGGFTIVEFIIAISIGVILVSVGIPRFNSFIQRQQFIGQVNNLAACLQEANREATAPTIAGAQLFVAEMVNKTPSTGGFTCTVTANELIDTNGSFSMKKVTDYAGTIYQVDKVAITQAKMSGFTKGAATDPYTTMYSNKLQIVFSAQHKGYPVWVLHNGVGQVNTLVSAARPQNGFKTEITTKSIENPAWFADVVVDTPGTPVTVTFRES